MSRSVKNFRWYSPRARWKIDAPRMIVLSTSKNAAACRSGGTASAASSSGAAAPAGSQPSSPTAWRGGAVDVACAAASPATRECSAGTAVPPPAEGDVGSCTGMPSL